MSCWGPTRADVYMMKPGAIPHLSAKVWREILQSVNLLYTGSEEMIFLTL